VLSIIVPESPIVRLQELDEARFLALHGCRQDFHAKSPAKQRLDRKTSMGRKAGSPDRHPAKTIEATWAPANSIFRHSPFDMALI